MKAGHDAPAHATNRALRSHVKLRQLKLLVALDELRHLGKAADSLCITQPAVSKSLAEIEAVFGTRLFTRSVRGTHPTPDGELVIRLAHVVLSELDQTVEELAARARGVTGRISIGAVGPTAHLLLARTVHLIKQQSPTTTVMVEEDSLQPLLGRLRSGKVEAVLTRLEPIQLDPDIEVVQLYDEPAAVICGRKHRLARQRHVDWAMLCEQPWVVPSRFGSMLPKLKEMFAVQGHAPPADLVVGMSLLSALLLVQERSSVCLLARSAAWHFERSGLAKILPVNFPLALAPVGALHRRTRQPSSGLTLLMACVRQAAVEIQREG